MSVEVNQIEAGHNILAALFAWLTCAGFVTLPDIFTSFQNSTALGTNPGGQIVQEAVRNLRLLPLAGTFCLIGLTGTCFLWWRHRENYIWLISHLFLYVYVTNLYPKAGYTGLFVGFFVC
ncbi:hypothetical protein F5Y02DRAFT_405892 [Annulohypoxylon stygium]|nr:hypothetical protein F5Y02DRAFT_405892 [Annulohypoxylon stygium]